MKQNSQEIPAKQQYELEPKLPKNVTLHNWEDKPDAAPDRFLVNAAFVGLRWRNCIITLEEINPERALNYSEMVPPKKRVNRDYRKSNLVKIRKAMRENKFPLFNGNSIVFNCNGWLIDGKHRLKSAIDEGRTFVALVVRGVDEDTFASIDVGQPKRFEDMLYVCGYKDNNNLASAVKMVDEFKRMGRISETTGGYSASEAPELAEKYHGLSDCGHFNKKLIEDYLTQSIAMAMHYLLSEVDKDRADQFFEKLITGIGIVNKSDPHVNLRNTLRELKRRSNEQRTGLNRKLACAFIIKAWNGILTGHPVKLFRLSEDEEFPKILAPERPKAVRAA